MTDLLLSQIKLGDPAQITLEGYGDSTLFPATVIAIDPSTTLSNDGTPAYKVTLQFNQEDDRVKTGMSVNADIQAAVAENALTVPSGAIKTTNGASYVMVFNPALPTPTGTEAHRWRFWTYPKACQSRHRAARR